MSENQLLRLPEVIKQTGLSRSSIYSFMAQGLFPKPIKLGMRAVAWRQSDVDAWVSSRAIGHMGGFDVQL